MNTETVARVLAALADNDGRLTVDLAKKAGINRTTLTRAANVGVLRRTVRGTYVDPALPPRELALKGAHLSRSAVLSHRGAAHFHGMDGARELVLEWSIPHSSHQPESSLIHRRRRFSDLDVVEINGVLVTSVAQTLGDLGAVTDADLVERAAESALRTKRAEETWLREFATSMNYARHGGPMLRNVLDRRPLGARPTGSDVETIALQVYRRQGILAVRQWEVLDEEGWLIGFGDFGFPPKACITEIDGVETHDLANRQHDYNRQGRIEDMGYLVRRFTCEDVLRRPRYLCERTRRAIANARYL